MSEENKIPEPEDISEPEEVAEPEDVGEPEQPGDAPEEQSISAADGSADEAPDDGLAGDDLPAEDEDPVVVLTAEAADLKDKLLRALAESENVRRRAEREKADTAKYAISNFAREMVSVADNLRRALDSVGEAAAEDAPPLDQLVVGVEMTEREMLTAFERCGIERIEALGQRFDHNFHEALYEVEDQGVPSGTVVQQVESGYVLNGRLLRPAKVGISKGGPKPAAPVSAVEEAAEAAPGGGPSTAYEQRVDADKPADSGTQIDTEL
jgi:molecular chaperone GrpE